MWVISRSSCGGEWKWGWLGVGVVGSGGVGAGGVGAGGVGVGYARLAQDVY